MEINIRVYRDVGESDIIELGPYVFTEEVWFCRGCLDRCLREEDSLKNKKGDEQP